MRECRTKKCVLVLGWLSSPGVLTALKYSLKKNTAHQIVPKHNIQNIKNTNPIVVLKKYTDILKVKSVHGGNRCTYLHLLLFLVSFGVAWLRNRLNSHIWIPSQCLSFQCSNIAIVCIFFPLQLTKEFSQSFFIYLPHPLIHNFKQYTVSFCLDSEYETASKKQPKFKIHWNWASYFSLQ